MKYIKAYENTDSLINNVFNNIEIIIKKVIDKCSIYLLNDVRINKDGCIVSYSDNEFFLYVPVEERDFNLVTQKFRTDRYNNREYNYNYFDYDDGFFKFFISINKYNITSSIFINNKRLPENIDLSSVKNFIEKLNYIANTNEDVLKIKTDKYNL